MNNFEEKRRNYEKFVAMQTKLVEDKVVVNYETDELEYLQNPVGQACFKAKPPDLRIIVPEDTKDRLKQIGHLIADPPKVQLNIVEYDSSKPRIYPEVPPKHPVIRKTYNRKEKVRCEVCGRWVTRAGLSQHRKKNIHLIYANANKRLLHLMNPDLRDE